MPSHSVSRDIKARIPILHNNLGYSIKEIGRVLGIKKSLIYRTLYFHRLHGVTYNPHSTQQSRHRDLTSTDISFIQGLLHQKHASYLDEIQEQLLIRRGTNISLMTLSRTLHRLNFTHKSVSGHALERNTQLRAVFMNRIADQVPDPNMLMFGDESSKDARTSVRRQGWSLRGTRCIQKRCFVRGRRFSILPILSLDGIIAYDIIEGSVTSEWFVQFLRELVVCSDLSSSVGNAYFQPDTSDKSIPWAAKCTNFGQLSNSSWRGNP
jgi:transposase